MPPSATDDGHMSNPNWAPHALLHNAAMFCTLLAMMLIFLWLITRKSREPQVDMLAATLFPFGFWSGFYYITTLFPQTSLLNFMHRDASGHLIAFNINNIDQWPAPALAMTPFIAGIPIYVNVTIGTALTVIAAGGYGLYCRGLSIGETDAKLIP